MPPSPGADGPGARVPAGRATAPAVGGPQVAGIAQVDRQPGRDRRPVLAPVPTTRPGSPLMSPSRPNARPAPSAPARRSRARRGRGADLRDEIVAAAAQLLAESGDEEAVSIRRIADAVGVTPPSIYLHFADKAHLILAVCEDRLTGLDRRLDEAADGADDPVDAVLRRCRAYIDFGRENPEHYRIVFLSRPVGSERLSEVSGTAVLEHMVEAVQRGIDAGAIVADDAGALALRLWFTVHGLTSLLLSKAAGDLPAADPLIDDTLAWLGTVLRGGPTAGAPADAPSGAAAGGRRPTRRRPR
jgi:AcrR family transcriptional regulator